MTTTNALTLSAFGRNLALDETFCRWLDRELGKLDRTTQRLAAYEWLCKYFSCTANLNERNQDPEAYREMATLIEIFKREVMQWGLPPSPWMLARVAMPNDQGYTNAKGAGVHTIAQNGSYVVAEKL